MMTQDQQLGAELLAHARSLEPDRLSCVLASARVLVLLGVEGVSLRHWTHTDPQVPNFGMDCLEIGGALIGPAGLTTIAAFLDEEMTAGIRSRVRGCVSEGEPRNFNADNFSSDSRTQTKVRALLPALSAYWTAYVENRQLSAVTPQAPAPPKSTLRL